MWMKPQGQVHTDGGGVSPLPMAGGERSDAPALFMSSGLSLNRRTSGHLLSSGALDPRPMPKSGGEAEGEHGLWPRVPRERTCASVHRRTVNI